MNFISKPWLLLPAKMAHDFGPFFLNILGKTCPTKLTHWNEFQWRDLTFRNPLGIAGGVDKNAEQFVNWSLLGCGFVEIGTLTPQKQGPNPGRILDRNLPNQALWNKMGFPNMGIDYALEKIKNNRKNASIPLFANIGKNRETTQENAAQDYVTCINKLQNYVDGFVINISSPNTKNLRDLLNPEILKPFLTTVLKANSAKKTILLKMSPDLDDSLLYQILETSLSTAIFGWILTNTTLSRTPNLKFPVEGGMSGQPLADLSKSLLKKTIEFLGEKRKDKLIISAGGVMNYQDVSERLNMGANLVQVYAALVFSGPFFFAQTLKELIKMDFAKNKK